MEKSAEFFADRLNAGQFVHFWPLFSGKTSKEPVFALITLENKQSCFFGLFGSVLKYPSHLEIWFRATPTSSQPNLSLQVNLCILWKYNFISSPRNLQCSKLCFSEAPQRERSTEPSSSKFRWPSVEIWPCQNRTFLASHQTSEILGDFYKWV